MRGIVAGLGVALAACAALPGLEGLVATEPRFVYWSNRQDGITPQRPEFRMVTLTGASKGFVSQRFDRALPTGVVSGYETGRDGPTGPRLSQDGGLAAITLAVSAGTRSFLDSGAYVFDAAGGAVLLELGASGVCSRYLDTRLAVCRSVVEAAAELPLASEGIREAQGGAIRAREAATNPLTHLKFVGFLEHGAAVILVDPRRVSFEAVGPTGAAIGTTRLDHDLDV